MSPQAQSLHERLERIWGSPPGWGRLSAVNHTAVGRRFIVTGFVFFLIGGMLAMVMRVQLSVPANDALSAQAYREFFTMHGTTMMFLFAVPVLEGFAAYLIPKMIGARDLVFPRLGAFGYYCYVFGGVLLYSSFFFGAAPDGGWFMYVPLTDKTFTPGLSSDFWLIGVTFAEISAVCAAVELVVSILRTRAPGMSLDRMPIFAWAILVTSLMIVFAFPPLIMGSILLEVERAFGFVFYDANRGGHPLLWQHLFWFFGHPEVYIIFLPAAGMLSMIIPVFSREPLVGYRWVVLAAIATGFLSFGLWVHHMFTVGIPYLSLAFFSAASMAVVIPSGIQVFAWIATMWRGKPELTLPMFYVLGFFFIFVIGGLTGVMLAFVPFDWQAHDTHFVVAHLHYVLIGGMVFPLFAALYYWLPLLTGRHHSPWLGRLAFWLIFIGFNVTFLPMHYTGLIGMPRRVYTYEAGLGWEMLNLVSTIGAFVLTVGIGTIVVDVLLHTIYGTRSQRDPWRAETLEWAVPVPVPSYNFASIPTVRGRSPLQEQPELVREIDEGALYLADTDHGKRETLGTSAVSAEPQEVIRLSGSSWTPLATAALVAVFFVAILAQWYWASAVALVVVVIACLCWAWTTGDRTTPDRLDAGRGLVLPSQYASATGPGYWGVWITILADGALFGSLVFGYFFLWTASPDWPPPGREPVQYALPTLGLGALLLGSAAFAWGMRRHRAGARASARLGWIAAIVCALAWAIVHLLAWPAAAPQTHAYASVVYAIVAFSLVHVAIAVLMAGFLCARVQRGYAGALRVMEPRVVAVFWHYAVLQWVVGYAVVYLLPLLSAP
jgi:cytochrome c oxidase subunit I+III